MLTAGASATASASTQRGANQPSTALPPTLSPTAPPAARGQAYSLRRAQTSQRRGPTPVSGRPEDPVSAAEAPSPPTGPGAPVPSLSIPGSLLAPGAPNPPFSGFPNISPLAPPGQPHSPLLPRIETRSETFALAMIFKGKATQ